VCRKTIPSLVRELPPTVAMACGSRSTDLERKPMYFRDVHTVAWRFVVPGNKLIARRNKVTEVDASGQTVEWEEYMGASAPANPKGFGGGPNTAFGGLNAPLRIQPVQPVQPIQPIQAIQPIQPIRGMAADKGVVFGDLRTMNLPGAPRLPQNPYADAAWRRQIYGPK
jgi:hypothetical protein